MLEISNEMYNLLLKKVNFIASKYSGHYNKEDLIQAGMLGVVKARDKFDEKLGVKFSTFCELYIKGEILDFIRKDKNIRVSRDFIKLKKKVDYVNENSKNKLSIDQLSTILNEDRSKILEVLTFDQNVSSIDEKELSIAEKEKIDLIDYISLKDAFNELDDEEKRLIEERYYYGKTQSEIAKNMNISQVKAYRLERKILDKLGNKLAP